MNETDVGPGPEQQAAAPEALPTHSRLIPYPPLERHGIIGDRRTAALVAADGTLDWLCLPDFDSGIVFGALLDSLKGGHWRLGPAGMMFGRQNYLEESMVLETRWDLPEGVLLLQEAMLWPQSSRPPEQANVRAIVRCLRCLQGKVQCESDLQARLNFQDPSVSLAQYPAGFTLQFPESSLRYWSNLLPGAHGARLHQQLELKAGEELWAVLELGAAGHTWTVEAARNALEETRQYWRQWVSGIRRVGLGDTEIRRSAMVVHLLTYAPNGSVVAAPTTSLPERIGGDWNSDYRLCWIRDASLAVSMLARLGNLQETEQYLAWLVQRLSYFGRPLKVLYEIRGDKQPRAQELAEASGYRDSRPVRVGNRAYKQHQLGSFGYLADCVWTYLQAGGTWRDEYWELVRRLANYTTKHWQKPDNSLWELPERQQYLNCKVLSWVMLERAISIARKVNPSFDTSSWQATATAIHKEVLSKGWSERLGSFRQRYEAENLDAAELLISVLEFLPGDHPQVLATIDKISEFLSIDNLVYRFDPLQVPGLGPAPLGQFEGAFLISTFWLATACAKAGRLERAEAILARAEKITSPLGLFAEGADPRTGGFLGNMPLLFSHVEYVRARLEVAQRRSMAGNG